MIVVISNASTTLGEIPALPPPKKRIRKKNKELIYSDNELLLPAGQKKPKCIEMMYQDQTPLKKTTHIFGTTEESK